MQVLPYNLEFLCPQCKGSLTLDREEYFCPACTRKYPVRLGIPDFRVFPDPYIDYFEDYKKGEFLANQSRSLDFRGLLQLYWELTPEVSRERAQRFMRNACSLVDKGIHNLRQVEAEGVNGSKSTFNSILEIGCGTGGFLVAAKEKSESVIGADIAFRWLVVARKRLDEQGLHVPLVCCCAEFLPFKTRHFDLIVGDAILEHVRDQEATLRECRRVLSDRGTLFLTTPNRFSITAEPHVRVWGVGFLPRKWMNRYVSFVKNTSYRHIRLISYFELRRLLKKCSLNNSKILLASVPKGYLKNFSVLEKTQISVYELIRRIPLMRSLLYILGPYFHIICQARKAQQDQI